MLRDKGRWHHIRYVDGKWYVDGRHIKCKYPTSGGRFRKGEDFMGWIKK